MSVDDLGGGHGNSTSGVAGPGDTVARTTALPEALEDSIPSKGVGQMRSVGKGEPPRVSIETNTARSAGRWLLSPLTHGPTESANPN